MMFRSAERDGPAPDAAEPVAPGRPAARLRAVAVEKSFGATRALRGVSLDFAPGEVHVILGENGSGKSTLVKIVSGVQRPDRGVLELDGARLSGFSSPAQAARHGVAAVFQEVLVAEPRSVLDNVWLGTDTLLRDVVGLAERRARATAVLERLLGTAPDLRTPAGDLPLSDRQACCIARALVRDAQILVLDEATSALDIATRDRLFAILRERREQGTAIVFISHRMDEIAELGDRITVMRSGVVVGSRVRGEATAGELVRMMTGEETERARERVAAAARRIGAPALEIRGLRLRADRPPIDFSLHAGELVGLAGLEGHGQDAFLKSAWGGTAHGGRAVRVDTGRERALSSPAAAARAGVVYVPRERRNEALLTHMSILDNFALPTLGRDRVRGRLSDRRSARRLASYVERLRITLADPGDPIETLSGGNQQKVVMARWLAAGPDVLLLNDPTRGVDVGAKRDLYRLLDELTEAGVAVLMLSTEVDEHVELMDRVLVFRDHALAAEIGREQLTRRTLIASFFGEAGDA